MTEPARAYCGTPPLHSGKGLEAAHHAYFAGPKQLPTSCADPDGRVKPITEEELRLRNASAIEALNALEQISDETDSEELWREIFRGIDGGRQERKLFEGMY